MGTYNIKVSVIIPVYNAEKYLKTALESILTQNYKNLEILLINNNSTDKSEAICSEYAQNHDNIHVFNELKAGAGHARNCGIKHANGDYILFVDAGLISCPSLDAIVDVFDPCSGLFPATI
ncbi:MAG: hypothetical protein BHV97_02870 [Clostridium sp. CAG:349_48_7]|nr:MAG: hypothetical protein BHV97_02870 [Clostridium sp. CAG:349_48_7]